MSQISEKEMLLMAAVIKNANGSFNASVDWDQVALDAEYKGKQNAKTMWSRLEKKMVEVVAAHAAGDDNDDDGENPTAAPAPVSKKRKATGKKVGRPAKKSKGSAANASTNDKSIKVETSIEQEDEAEAA